MRSQLMLVVVMAVWCLGGGQARGADTTISYQGRLDDGGSAAEGLYDMTFALWDELAGGAQVGTPFALLDVPVSEGLFTVELDFGADAFDNSGRWLEIVVEGTTLAPRQAITRAPYSIQTRGIFIGDDGDVTFNSMDAVEGTMTMTSIGGIDLIIDADTNNTGEDQNARIVLRQDGGVVVTRVGFREAANSFEIMHEWDTNLILGTNNQDRLTITSDGFVGIGTTTPSFPLQVQADSGIRTIYGYHTGLSGANSGVVGRSDSDSGTGVLGWVTSLSGVNYGVSGRSNSDRGRGVYGLAANDTGTTYGVFGESDSTSGRGVFGLATHDTGINIGVYGQSNSPSGFDFFAAGVGTNYGSSSSRRWKHNVVNIDSPLDRLAALRGVYFDWDEKHGGQHDVGMIAEEVGKVLPEIVQYEENGVDAIGMDYSKMTPLLVEAVNALRSESNRRLAEKDDEINDLRQQLNELQQVVEWLASNQEKEIAR